MIASRIEKYTDRRDLPAAEPLLGAREAAVAFPWMAFGEDHDLRPVRTTPLPGTEHNELEQS